MLKKCIQLILQSTIKSFVWTCIIIEQIAICLFACFFVSENDSEIVATPLCLRNISKGCSVDDMKETGLKRYVYDFSVNYSNTSVDDILDIHKFLMEKETKHKMFGFIKKCIFIKVTFLSNFTSVNLLSCISMNNQEYKVRPEVVNFNSKNSNIFSLLVLKQINTAVVAIILVTRMQKIVFLML